MELNLLDIVIHMINIVVLYILLRLILYKPVQKFMAARTAKVEAALANAKTAETEAAALKATMGEKLRFADEEVAAYTNTNIKEANESAQNILVAAQAEAQNIVVAANEQATFTRKQALEGMQAEITKLSVALASDILKREVNEADNKSVIDSFFESAV